MSTGYARIVSNKLDAHHAATLAYQFAVEVINQGKQALIQSREHEPDRSIQQNRFYWGPCLKEISEQARIDGQRWASEAWHELFKRMFLGYEIKKVRVAGRAKTTVIRRLRSTTGLKVRAMSEYLEKVQAFATTDLGVMFSVASWEGYE